MEQPLPAPVKKYSHVLKIQIRPPRPGAPTRGAAFTDNARLRRSRSTAGRHLRGDLPTLPVAHRRQAPEGLGIYPRSIEPGPRLPPNAQLLLQRDSIVLIRNSFGTYCVLVCGYLPHLWTLSRKTDLSLSNQQRDKPEGLPGIGRRSML